METYTTHTFHTLTSDCVLFSDNCCICVCVCVPGVYILIVAGGLVMLVGFFGCCGAVRESQCLLGSVSPNTHRHTQKIIFELTDNLIQ